MSVKTLNAEMIAKMFLSGAHKLESEKEYINELNVFPVPDGDTGTNMSLTIMSAAKEVNHIAHPDMKSIAKAISSGSLRGARGNSGVILSQLFRGFTKVIREYNEIDVVILADAFQKAKETAYKAVMKPKEGTILTVARGMAEKAAELAEEMESLDEFIPAVLSYGDEVLAGTPELLPILKEAGVVDSGGQGLMTVLRGAYDAFLGKEMEYTFEVSDTPKTAASGGASVKTLEAADIKFGYCTEFIIMLEKEFTDQDEADFKAYLESIGDSIVCVADDDVVKIHVHTNDPGLAIQRALTFGQLTRMKIDNMREEHQERLFQNTQKLAEEQKAAGNKPTPRKDVGFITVSIGEGLNDIFRELGVDHIIEGGQTMNPSTEDMLFAIDQINADHIFILPNNKNIILAANQAQALVEDKDIIVIPTKTVPQGITAVINYNPDLDIPTNVDTITREIRNVKTGQVTYAVRDTRIDDKEIHEGDIMGIGDEGIMAVGTSIAETTKKMLSEMVDEESELISIYYGSDIPKETAEDFIAELEETYEDLDIDAHYGGQPIYYYVLAVE